AKGAPSFCGGTGGEERIRTSGSVLPDQPLSRRLPSATRPPLQDALAEGVGFEPTELSLSGFQDRRLKPLGHPSARSPSASGHGQYPQADLPRKRRIGSHPAPKSVIHRWRRAGPLRSLREDDSEAREP